MPPETQSLPPTPTPKPTPTPSPEPTPRPTPTPSKELQPIKEGDAFYLEEPIQLDEDTRLTGVIFTKQWFQISFTTTRTEGIAEDYRNGHLVVVAGDRTYVAGSFGSNSIWLWDIHCDDELFNSNLELYNKLLYEQNPISCITFIFLGDSFEIDLKEGTAPYMLM